MRLYTVGHGTLEQDRFAALLQSAGIRRLVDVRRFPGSRRHPHFTREAMTNWLRAASIAYAWEEDLGGRRSRRAASPHTALHDAAFQGYADHMGTAAFRGALERLLAHARSEPAAVCCAESLWWRCHRRMIADAASLLHDAAVLHLSHDGRLASHRVTEGARRDGDRVVYDAGETPPLPGVGV